MYTLITTAKLNDVDPQAWLADVYVAAARASALGVAAGRFIDRRLTSKALVNHPCRGRHRKVTAGLRPRERFFRFSRIAAK